MGQRDGRQAATIVPERVNESGIIELAALSRSKGRSERWGRVEIEARDLALSVEMKGSAMALGAGRSIASTSTSTGVAGRFESCPETGGKAGGILGAACRVSGCPQLPPAGESNPKSLINTGVTGFATQFESR